MNCSFLRRETGKAHNGEAVANFSEVGGGAVQFDDSALRLPENRVGLETFAVVQISDEDFSYSSSPTNSARSDEIVRLPS
jgi:hypothetical protein